MKLQQVPARQGALWVRQGFGVFFKRPLQFAALFAGFMFLSSLLAIAIPWVGNLLALWALPLVTLTFMATSRQAALQAPFSPLDFWRLLGTRSASRKALVQLGLAYVVCVALASGLSHLLYGDLYDKFFTLLANKKPTQADVQSLLQSPGLLMSMVLPTSLMTLVSAVFWHAPPLVHWGAQPLARSLFFSWMACWRNKGAFLVYSVTWLATMLAFTLVSSVVLGIMGQPTLLPYATAPAVLMFSTAFYASLYATYADCFAEDDPAGPTLASAPPAGPDHA